MEIWKDIKGFEGLYQVSSIGTVSNFKHLLKPRVEFGYRRVNLYRTGSYKLVFIHRLVAEHFIENPHGYPQVNHINGNKANNNAENLEWCTVSQNNLHAYRTGLRKTKLTQLDVINIRRTYPEKNTSYWATKLGVSRGSISAVIRGKNWRL